MPPAESKTYTFEAIIHEATLGGACVFFPYDTEAEFGTAAAIPVQATIDDIPYRGSLTRYGQPQHMLHILKSIREQLGKGPGDTVQVTLTRDTEPRTVDVPADLTERMQHAGVLEFFNSLSYTHRREYTRWITEAKREETRLRRLAKSIDMLQQKIRTPG